MRVLYSTSAHILPSGRHINVARTPWLRLGIVPIIGILLHSGPIAGFSINMIIFRDAFIPLTKVVENKKMNNIISYSYIYIYIYHITVENPGDITDKHYTRMNVSHYYIIT